jgi:hypothetical protein
MQAVTPLVSAPEGMRGDLELRHRGRLLADPRALTIELSSRGRKDIANDAYNDGQPLQFNVGSPIVEILDLKSEPATLPVPRIAVGENCIYIGPSLIGRKHRITITILTDGGEPRLDCRSPLIDVRVREKKEEMTFGDAGLSLGPGAGIMALGFVVANALLKLLARLSEE